MKTRYFGICGVLVVAALALTMLAYPHLPTIVPIHWDADGQANGFGPRWLLFILGPGLMAAMMALFAWLPRISPKQFEVETFEATYQDVMLIVVAMVGCVYVITICAAWSGPVNISQAILVAMSVFFALIGNLMGKVRRNFWIGIRTPWTLASGRVWYATHRLAGKTMVLTALASLVGVFTGLPFLACVALLVAGALVPAANSLFFYKQLERAGGLESQ